jgi:hypothetical protein
MTVCTAEPDITIAFTRDLAALLIKASKYLAMCVSRRGS